MNSHTSMNAREITLALGGVWNSYNNMGIACCPAHNDRRPSLSLRQGKNGQLLIYCHAGCEFQEIIDSLCSIDTKDKFHHTLKATRQDYNASEFARRIWNESIPIKNTPAETYLRNRGITCSLPESMRFHPSCNHFNYGRSAALICRVDGSSQFAIHRTFITNDGVKQKWDSCKTMLGSVRGGTVRLLNSPHSAKYVVCEGIETGLSLACGIMTDECNIWSCLSSSGLMNVILPNRDIFSDGVVPQLIIAMDSDEAGRKAAESLAMRATHYGYNVSIICPRDGHNDFNDVLLSGDVIRIEPISYKQYIQAKTAVRTITEDMVPKPIFEFSSNISLTQYTPIDYSIISSIISIASVIGNFAIIHAKPDGTWSLHPNLWAALVGEPSSGKTISSNASLAPLKAIEDELLDNWKQQNGDSDFHQLASKIRAESTKKVIANLLATGDISAKQEAYNLHRKMVQSERGAPRIIVNDVTMESLGVIMKNNPKGLLMVRTELSGFLAEMNQADKKLDRSFYLQAYDGKSSFTFDRIGRGHIYIPRATLSLIGTVQPTEIKDLIRSALNMKSNDGLIQRMQLMVFPDEIKQYVWTECYGVSKENDNFTLMLKKINEYAKHKSAVVFNVEAQEQLKQWVTKIKTELINSNEISVIKSHQHKMIDTVIKLSFIFHIVNVITRGGDATHIQQDALTMAIKWYDYLLSHAKRIYAI